MSSRVLSDVVKKNSVWTIRRWKNEKDMENKKIYCAEEAKEMFKVPQITVVRGGIAGMISDFGLLLNKAKLGFNRELFNTFQHSFSGNCLLNEGINEAWTILASASSGTKFSNANAYLGVGDDDTAADPAQTGLNPGVVGNKVYVAMDLTYPTYGTSQLATWRSTFGSAVGNFNWREFTVANGNSDAAVNLNRKVSSQGTKASGQSWELTLTITLT